MGSCRRVAALTVGLLITMTACSSDSDGISKLEPRVQRMVPSGAPSVAVTPHDGQPAETRPVSGKFFSLYVPANFQEKPPQPMRHGDPLLVFEAPSSKPSAPVRVAVAQDNKATTTAIEGSMEQEIEAKQNGVKEFARSMVKWPGAQSAVLLQSTETPAGAAAADKSLRYSQIVAQVNDHLVVTIVAVAPVSEFDSAGLAKIVETFRPHA
jgi:hypothetical protein